MVIVRREQISGAQPPESFVEAFEALTRGLRAARREARAAGGLAAATARAEMGRLLRIKPGSSDKIIGIFGISLVGGIVSYE